MITAAFLTVLILPTAAWLLVRTWPRELERWAAIAWSLMAIFAVMELWSEERWRRAAEAWEQAYLDIQATVGQPRPQWQEVQCRLQCKICADFADRLSLAATEPIDHQILSAEYNSGQSASAPRVYRCSISSVLKASGPVSCSAPSRLLLLDEVSPPPGSPRTDLIRSLHKSHTQPEATPSDWCWASLSLEIMG